MVRALPGARFPAPFSVRIAFLAFTSLAALQAAAAQEAPSTPGTVTLRTIDVEGQSPERGDGPVGGYVARQSRAGTKTDTPILRTPQSVSVVSREQMDDQSVLSVAEALRYTPGVFAEYRGASNLRDELFVRGFYYVPRYLDGLFLGGDLSYAKMDPYLLERVELLSGPSSVLYGQANPGGVVNMVSKKPTETPLREIVVTFGTDNHFGGAFDFSDKLPGSTAFSYRVVGTGLSRELQEDYAKQRSFAIAPSITWAPSKAFRLTILGGYQYEPEAGFRNFLDAAGTVLPIAGYGDVPRKFFVSDPNYEYLRRTQAWGGYEFEYKPGGVFTFRQNARYHWVNHVHRTLVWGSASADPATGALTVISRTASGGKETWRQFAIDNQVQADFRTGPADHTLLAGIDYRFRKRDYQWGYNWWSIPSINLAAPVYGNFDYASVVLPVSSLEKLTAHQTGLYLQDQVRIGGLSLLAGLRYDIASTDIDDRLASNSDHSYSDRAFTWRLGALYAFESGFAPYVSYSTSFEPALYSPPAGAEAFNPTTARQFEVGIKYAPPGTNVLLTAAYYDLRQRDVVGSYYDPGIGAYAYKQIGKIHNRGVELSARAKLFEDFSLVASYAYTFSKIVESGDANEIGKMPARIPSHQASLWGTYRFSAGFLRGLTLGGGMRYIGRSWGDNANSFRVDSATLFDAMLAYDFGARVQGLKGVSLQVNAKNLADKRYVASCANAYACFYGEGLTVAASLKYRW